MEILDKDRFCGFNLQRYYPTENEKVEWGYGMEEWGKCMERGWFWRVDVLWGDKVTLDLSETKFDNLEFILNQENVTINAPDIKNIFINKGIFDISIDRDIHLLDENLQKINEVWYHTKNKKWLFDYFDSSKIYEADNIEELTKLAIKCGEIKNANL